MTRRLVFNHAILLAGNLFLLWPIALILVASTNDTATLTQDGLQWQFGSSARQNYQDILALKAGFIDGITTQRMLRNSFIVGFGVASLTTLFSLLSAFGIVYFRTPFSGFLFWLIFATLLFPLESRFITTFQVTSDLGLINSHLGMILPAIAAALGTFFFRQFFLGLPEEYTEAAILDGAGPWRFFRDFIVPLSAARAGAVFVVSFMIGWNQYLWPMMITTDEGLYTLIRGVRFVGQESGPGMAFVVITILPPFIMLLGFQRWFFNDLSGEQNSWR